MTELPRYIGRHASPEAAEPSAGMPPPDDAAREPDPMRDDAVNAGGDRPAPEPAMPRLEFDPTEAGEPTTLLDPDPHLGPAAGPGPNPGADEDPPSDWWRPRSEPARDLGPGRSDPHPPGPPGVSGRPPAPPGAPAPSPTTGSEAAADPWTAPAPDLGVGSAPQSVTSAAPEASAEPSEAEAPPDDRSGPRQPEPAAETEPAADREDATEPSDATEPGARPTEDVPLPDDEPAARSAPESQTSAEPTPEPEADSDMPFKSESSWSPSPGLPTSETPGRRAAPAVPEIDSHGLARIALLDAVKEVWPGGTPDLSAWLAAHLDLLEDPLGFSLTPHRHAPPAGRFVDEEPEPSPLDIPGNLLTADLGGAAVVVRAQAHDADTDGFGALLAAAAAAQARTAVWVCPRIEPGFRQALRWVGGDPSANVRLYGLEMYLVQIAGSPTAPLFDAVVSPGTP